MFKLYGSLFSTVLYAASNDGGVGPAPSSNPPTTNEASNTPEYMRAAGNRQQDFGKALKDFIKSTSTSMKRARELADMAMEHFIAHGDTVYFQAYTDAIKTHANNYVRLEALASWATTFAPLTFDKGKWTKDKDRATAIDWDNNKDIRVKRDNKMVGFADISFWEFAPEKKIEPLDAEALLAFILGKVNSKKLAERVKGNASAEATLTMLKSTLTPLKPVVLAEAPSEAEGASAA